MYKYEKSDSNEGNDEEDEEAFEDEEEKNDDEETSGSDTITGSSKKLKKSKIAGLLCAMRDKLNKDAAPKMKA